MTVSANNSDISVTNGVGVSNTGEISVSKVGGITLGQLKAALNTPTDAVVKLFESDMTTEITNDNAKVASGNIVSVASADLSGSIAGDASKSKSLYAQYKYYTVDIAMMSFDNGTDELYKYYSKLKCKYAYGH